MKRHPYLAVLVLGWLCALPAVWVRYPDYDFVTKVFGAIGAGFIPMIVGWITVFRDRQIEVNSRFRRGVIATVWASVIFFALAIWAANRSGSA